MRKSSECSLRSSRQITSQMRRAECSQDEPDICVKKISEFQADGINGLCLCAQNYPLIREKISELKALKIPVITFNSDIENFERMAEHNIGKENFITGESFNEYGRCLC